MKKMAIKLITVVAFMAGLISCTEEDEPVYIYHGYEAVDLGLSVKWASYNVGAKSPEDYGDYFAWGET